jgi:mono/diheme cytochrome c family protein
MFETLKRSRRAKVAAVVIGLAGPVVAVGLPWDVDMADSQAVKAFEQVMRPSPEGVVAHPSPISARVDSWGDPGNTTITSPMAPTAASIARGGELYDIYCNVCHGRGANLGTVMQEGRFPAAISAGVPREAALVGYPEGWIYNKIRYGQAGPPGREQRMPSYGWAMTDEEIWSVVHHVRRNIAPAVDAGQGGAP